MKDRSKLWENGDWYTFWEVSEKDISIGINKFLVNTIEEAINGNFKSIYMPTLNELIGHMKQYNIKINDDTVYAKVSCFNGKVKVYYSSMELKEFIRSDKISLL